jgi:hypothetical protein
MSLLIEVYEETDSWVPVGRSAFCFIHSPELTVQL